MTAQIKMKKQMERKTELALKKISDDLALEYTIVLESILTSGFISSLKYFKKFKEIITKKEKQAELEYEMETRLTIEFIKSLKDLRIIQKLKKKQKNRK